MGWDIHFIKSKNIEEILKDEDFKMEEPRRDGYAYMYVIDEEGEQSGLNISLAKPYLTYGYLPYGHKLGEFLWRLYTKFGIMFADTCLDDWLYLQDDCKDEHEEEVLVWYCYAHEMLNFFGDMLKDDKLIHGYYEEGEKLVNELLERSKNREVKSPEKTESEKESITDLPF